MIHIIDEYYVDGGAHDYTLTKKTNSVKKGNTIYRPLGYYSSVSNAVEGVRKILSRELTAEKDMELGLRWRNSREGIICQAEHIYKQILCARSI